MVNIEREITVDSEITIASNANCTQTTDLLSPAEPIGLPENHITCSQRDVLPVIDETRHEINIGFEEQCIVDNTVTISTGNCEQHPDNISSLLVEKPTRPTEYYNELVSDTLSDVPQVS